LTTEFAFHSFQKVIDISNHYDISGTVQFGSRVACISFTQAVWSKAEAKEWTMPFSSIYVAPDTSIGEKSVIAMHTPSQSFES
jgi:hypothetical protein